MSPLERLEEGLEQIRNMIGSEAQSGITDDEIKDTLWNAYYDVEASLNSILGKLATREGHKLKRSYNFRGTE